MLLRRALRRRLQYSKGWLLPNVHLVVLVVSVVLMVASVKTEPPPS